MMRAKPTAMLVVVERSLTLDLRGGSLVQINHRLNWLSAELQGRMMGGPHPPLSGVP